MIYPSDDRGLANNNIKQVQSVVLRMLKIFNAICKANDIPFWLEYGTMLGAVRHKGFIPWDNEADIGILRDDFEKLKSIIKGELPDDIFFQTKETDPLYYPSSVYIEAKLRDKYSNYVSFEKQNPLIKWHNGIQVDIFVYDFVDLDGKHCLINAFEQTLTEYNAYYLPEELEYLLDVTFEDETFMIPIGYDKYLERNYGDYWKLPPVEKQQWEFVDVFKHCDHKEVLTWPNTKF